MPRRVEWSPTSQDHLKRILAESRERFGRDHARRYRAQFRAAIANLRQFPEMGRPRTDFGVACRSVPVDPYIVLYEIVEAHIWIVAIIHQREDVALEEPE